MTNKMYLTTAEAKAMGLPSVQEQIDRYNAAVETFRPERRQGTSEAPPAPRPNAVDEWLANYNARRA